MTNFDQSTRDGDDAAFDREAALEFVRHDVDFLEELVDAFGEYIPKTLNQIKDGLAASNASVVAEAAHQIQGAVSNFRALKAKSTARTLEEAAEDQRFSDATDLFAELSKDLDQLHDELKRLIDELKSSNG